MGYFVSEHYVALWAWPSTFRQKIAQPVASDTGNLHINFRLPWAVCSWVRAEQARIEQHSRYSSLSNVQMSAKCIDILLTIAQHNVFFINNVICQLTHNENWSFSVFSWMQFLLQENIFENVFKVSKIFLAVIIFTVPCICLKMSPTWIHFTSCSLFYDRFMFLRLVCMRLNYSPSKKCRMLWCEACGLHNIYVYCYSVQYSFAMVLSWPLPENKACKRNCSRTKPCYAVNKRCGHPRKGFSNDCCDGCNNNYAS